MPTYTNANETTVYAGEPYLRLDPGDTTSTFYLKGLPSGVTLKTHTPILQPWELLGSATSVPMQAAIDVSAYDNIAVYNASDDACSISVNTDDNNAYFIPSLSKEVFANTNRIFGCIEVLTMGSGTVYIYGVR